MYYKFKVRHTLEYNQPPPSDFQSDSELRKIYTPNEWFNNLVEVLIDGQIISAVMVNQSHICTD